MKPKDVFRIIVATGGLYVIYRGVEDLIYGVIYTLGLSQYYLIQKSTPADFAVHGLIDVVLGALVLVGFFPLANWAFPEKNADDSEDEPEN